MVDKGWQAQKVFQLINKIFNSRIDQYSTKRLIHREYSLLIGSHLVKGSPEYLGRQLQMGLWFTTWHWVLKPQVPIQGSIHFWLLQARFRGQSELTTHSGLQDGGAPRYPWTQEQTACWFTIRHWLLGPQGDGLQRSTAPSGSKKKHRIIQIEKRIKMKLIKIELLGYAPFETIHRTKAFPDIPLGQLHIGTWLYTLQIAFCPQVPTQGSIHLLRTQALFWGQSLFWTHSGRQSSYGFPRYSGRQVQTPLLHSAFGPQGEGLQRSDGTSFTAVKSLQ